MSEGERAEKAGAQGKYWVREPECQMRKAELQHPHACLGKGVIHKANCCILSFIRENSWIPINLLRASFNVTFAFSFLVIYLEYCILHSEVQASGKINGLFSQGIFLKLDHKLSWQFSSQRWYMKTDVLDLWLLKRSDYLGKKWKRLSLVPKHPPLSFMRSSVSKCSQSPVWKWKEGEHLPPMSQSFLKIFSFSTPFSFKLLKQKLNPRKAFKNKVGTIDNACRCTKLLTEVNLKVWPLQRGEKVYNKCDVTETHYLSR